MLEDARSLATSSHGFPILVRDGVALLRARYRVGEQQLTLEPGEEAAWATTVARHDLEMVPWPETLDRGRTLVRVAELGGRRHRPRPAVEIPPGVFAATRSRLGGRLYPSDLVAICDANQPQGYRLVQLDPDVPWFCAGERRVTAAMVGLELDASLRFAYVTFAGQVATRTVAVGWGRRPKRRSGVFAATPSGGMPAAKPRHPARRVEPSKTAPVEANPQRAATPFRRAPLPPTLVLARPELAPYRAHPPAPAPLDANPAVSFLPATVERDPRDVVDVPAARAELELLWHDVTWNDAPGALHSLRGEPSSIASLSACPSSEGVARVVVVEGRLRSSFAPRAELEALLKLVRSLGGREVLADTLQVAEALLETPIEGAREQAAELVRRAGQRWRPSGGPELRTWLDRVLLAKRAYAQVAILGEVHLRAELDDATVYLPLALSSRLPLYAELDVRMAASIHPQQDASETSPIALRTLALARQTPTTG